MNTLETAKKVARNAVKVEVAVQFWDDDINGIAQVKFQDPFVKEIEKAIAGAVGQLSKIELKAVKTTPKGREKFHPLTVVDPGKFHDCRSVAERIEGEFDIFYTNYNTVTEGYGD